MAEYEDRIRREWIEKWRKGAEIDNAAWLKRMLDDSGDPKELIDSMTTVLNTMPVDDEEEDWRPNALLHWQRYGMRPDAKGLTTVRLHGDGSAVLFAESDSLDRIAFRELTDTLATNRIVIELPPSIADMDTMDHAIAFLESGLDLASPPGHRGAALPWNGDARRTEVDLSSAAAKAALQSGGQEEVF